MKSTSTELKKINKKFTNFSEEEQWLQTMAGEGWILREYDNENIDACRYVFEAVQSPEQKLRIYKIDFRSFDKKDDYEEYIELFEETGWAVLSRNKGYSKHIFYTDARNSNTTIFSDKESYRDREKRKMADSLSLTAVSVILFVASVVIYSIYGSRGFMFAGLVSLGSGLKGLLDYYRHRKSFKSLMGR
ncbi:hypothetical protein C2I18_02445 [Paenibacillus sp. PK3_47]|uniref:DUF2812 domain-containing protein n=1 Tax=Paenibacillus sp. PK3_47 TaxID=2072642 RepID=UPI00201D3A96|nr:DUF2812 domain-containing protein [Paenibacillus sp. PK3_47]UQZ32514.1 hypothetical protein C2I18_02445 [Paenibacillus sp. PK3_47]